MKKKAAKKAIKKPVKKAASLKVNASFDQLMNVMASPVKKK
jgi:hypothetical protein